MCRQYHPDTFFLEEQRSYRLCCPPLAISIRRTNPSRLTFTKFCPDLKYAGITAFFDCALSAILRNGRSQSSCQVLFSAGEARICRNTQRISKCVQCRVGKSADRNRNVFDFPITKQSQYRSRYKKSVAGSS